MSKNFENKHMYLYSISLLYHRPLFLLNYNFDILHPYVYILLHKYNMCMYHEEMEPGKKEILIDYFTNNFYVESESLIQLLLSL